jgi:broad specificity phosphatase PhoE
VNALATPSRSFLCLRHGATDWNRQGLFQGRTNIPLNDDGIAQAHAASRRLQAIQFDHIVTSPLIRAAKTAEIIASASSKPVSTDDGIIECDFGSLEGKSIRGTMAEHGITAMEELVSILSSDAEAWTDVSARSLRCVRKWLDHDPQTNVLFVCHDAVMQSMAETLCGRWFDNRHGTPFRFARTGDGWSVEEEG